MPSRIVALPMYDVKASELRAFWQGLKRHLRRVGLDGVPETLTEPDDLYGHWLDPSLLLSQACGYPLVRALAGKVRLVGTPRYAASGVDGASYRSRIVVRAADPTGSIADLRGRRAAFNARDSQSGYNTFRALVAPYAVEGRFFGAVIESGTLQDSLKLVQAGIADVAAVDCVTYALAADAAPEAVSGLRTLCFSEKAPGLPLITSRRTGDEDVARLRRAFAAACVDPALAECRASLRLEGFEVMPPETYGVCRAMEAQAVAHGYPALA